jgi:hypothetical protein
LWFNDLQIIVTDAELCRFPLDIAIDTLYIEVMDSKRRQEMTRQTIEITEHEASMIACDLMEAVHANRARGYDATADAIRALSDRLAAILRERGVWKGRQAT